MADIIKTHFNLGQRNNVNFYRDRNGTEIDLIIPDGQHLIPIEIKSGATINSSYFKGIKHFRELFPEKVKQAFVVYPGSTEQNRSIAHV